uniref:Uncharacterized protein n=1 Tax=Panagrolaimus superbus TaxID=310955 RepID=A0A914YGQ5_9BILA
METFMKRLLKKLLQTSPKSPAKAAPKSPAKTPSSSTNWLLVNRQRSNCESSSDLTCYAPEDGPVSKYHLEAADSDDNQHPQSTLP